MDSSCYKFNSKLYLPHFKNDELYLVSVSDDDPLLKLDGLIAKLVFEMKNGENFTVQQMFDLLKNGVSPTHHKQLESDIKKFIADSIDSKILIKVD